MNGPSREIVADLIARRHFSRQLLAWAYSDDLAVKGTVPNDALLAGVLVEVCERLDVIEQTAQKAAKRAVRRPT